MSKTLLIAPMSILGPGSFFAALGGVVNDATGFTIGFWVGAGVGAVLLRPMFEGKDGGGFDSKAALVGLVIAYFTSIPAMELVGVQGDKFLPFAGMLLATIGEFGVRSAGKIARHPKDAISLFLKVRGGK